MNGYFFPFYSHTSPFLIPRPVTLCPWFVRLISIVTTLLAPLSLLSLLTYSMIWLYDYIGVCFCFCFLFCFRFLLSIFHFFFFFFFLYHHRTRAYIFCTTPSLSSFLSFLLPFFPPLFPLFFPSVILPLSLLLHWILLPAIPSECIITFFISLSLPLLVSKYLSSESRYRCST